MEEIERHKLRVSMEDILDGMSADPLNAFSWHLDLETGKTVLISDDDAIDAAGERIELDADMDRYEPIPRSSSKEDYERMCRFTERVQDVGLRERFVVALDGRGAFGRFRRLLRGYPELQQAWHQEQRHAHIVEATRWLRSMGIEPVFSSEA